MQMLPKPLKGSKILFTSWSDRQTERGERVPTDGRAERGPGRSPPEPWLLRVVEAGHLNLVAPYEPAQRVATQRVPGRGPPAPPGALSANF
jgi:hypothetical protein